jgi:hypothetical protein
LRDSLRRERAVISAERLAHLPAPSDAPAEGDSRKPTRHMKA